MKFFILVLIFNALNTLENFNLFHFIKLTLLVTNCEKFTSKKIENKLEKKY